MKFRRMAIEREAPEGIGYEKIRYNLSESSVADQSLRALGLDAEDLVLAYGDHLGIPALRELIAAEQGVLPRDVLICPGAAAALFLVATSLLEKDDHLIVTRPNYASNLETPRLLGADISYLPLRFEEGYQLNPDLLRSLLRRKTRLVSLTYPHNPTGVHISELALKEIIREVERNKSLLLMDETYRELSFVPSPPSAAVLSERAISISSLSKAYGLPGIRIGWIICRDQELMESFLAAKEQVFITNSVLDEAVALRFLQQKEKLFPPIQESVKNNFELVRQFMAGQDMLEWVEPQAGCTCFPRIKEEIPFHEQAFHRVLLEQFGTYVGRGHWFDESGRHIRIGYAWENAANLRAGLQNLLEAICFINP